MNRFAAMAVTMLLVLLGADEKSERPTETLAEARAKFKTTIVRKTRSNEPVPQPPAGVFDVVKYDSPAGAMAAYLTPDPKDGKKHPAIVWITGGDCNTIGDVWTDAPRANDQTAAAYRKAGIVMMFPSLRGGNQNPGYREHFCGEVEDVLAAADYLAKQPYVDPARIYLGGHSTGGTLALLVAQSSPRFRATFSFGPVQAGSAYGPEFSSYSHKDRQELVMRAPISWLHCFSSPTFLIEGEGGNVDAMNMMRIRAKKNNVSFATFLTIKGADHFGILAPTNELIAKKILADAGEKTNIALTAGEIEAAVKK